MKTIVTYLASKQDEFMLHPFFTLLADLKSGEEINYFVPELTFWVMTFQDILRINEERIINPYFKKIAHHHRLEDAGHHKWFMYDKKYLAEHSENQEAEKDNVRWLYGKETQLTRDAAYAIMSEVYKAENERINIILLLTLESSGHVFFKKVVKQVRAAGEDSNLKYFSSSHLNVELAHELYEAEMEKKLLEEVLPLDLRRNALQMIDRCYDAFGKMFDGLTTACSKRLEIAKQRNVDHAKNRVDHR